MDVATCAHTTLTYTLQQIEFLERKVGFRSVGAIDCKVVGFSGHSGFGIGHEGGPTAAASIIIIVATIIIRKHRNWIFFKELGVHIELAVPFVAKHGVDIVPDIGNIAVAHVHRVGCDVHVAYSTQFYFVVGQPESQPQPFTCIEEWRENIFAGTGTIH